MEPSINLLEYLRSKTQVDIDSLNLKGSPFPSHSDDLALILQWLTNGELLVAENLGPFADCTSNQVFMDPNSVVAEIDAP